MNRNAQQHVHLRMVGREAAKLRVTVEIGGPKGSAVAGDVAQRGDRTGVPRSCRRPQAPHPGPPRDRKAFRDRCRGRPPRIGPRSAPGPRARSCAAGRTCRRWVVRHRLRDVHRGAGDPLEIGAELPIGFMRLGERGLRALAFGDVPDEGLPAPICQDAALTSTGTCCHRCAATSTPRHRRGPRHPVLAPPEPLDVALRYEVDDGLADDVFGFHPEQSAGGVVDVRVSSFEVGDEHAVGRLSIRSRTRCSLPRSSASVDFWRRS